MPVCPRPRPPRRTPSATFTLAYAYMEGCAGWNPGFEVVNTGTAVFRSAHITALDTVTSTTVEDTIDVLHRRSGCAIAQSIPVLDPGEPGYVYANSFGYNPTRHPLQAIVTLCTGRGSPESVPGVR